MDISILFSRSSRSGHFIHDAHIMTTGKYGDTWPFCYAFTQ
ncbi:hypothetical protein HMPREF0372_00301 [Flavonifractor plautii ATCC 29863]|uniref:Uncharacterized protein n=1 Tax=Flavonifractor plautii ATCC 29863 TaxID=411475 RepID=G9YLD5_FLAPL|nr:hypothetical protein HMPREF0372_00301 [Flavonifractor plautii ATCC 29863]